MSGHQTVRDVSARRTPNNAKRLRRSQWNCGSVTSEQTSGLVDLLKVLLFCVERIHRMRVGVHSHVRASKNSFIFILILDFRTTRWRKRMRKPSEALRKANHSAFTNPDKLSSSKEVSKTFNVFALIRRANKFIFHIPFVLFYNPHTTLFRLSWTNLCTHCITFCQLPFPVKGINKADLYFRHQDLFFHQKKIQVTGVERSTCSLKQSINVF